MTNITLLDGGLGQELVHRSGETPTNLWSTKVMFDHPGMVRDLHADYFAVGASIATTNTYCVHHDRIEDTDLRGKFHDLHAAALAEALAARPAGKRVAGSIGPLEASYRPDKHPPHDVAVPRYAEVARELGPHVDLIICETVASLAHARAVLEGARAAGKPVWLSVTVDDEDGTRLRSGEATADVCAIAVEGGAEALLANCSAPEAMPAALRALRAAGLPYGAYANGFTQITKDFLKDKPTVDSLHAREDLTPQAYADHVMAWVEMGATIVGGCCETGPAHIAELARRLRAQGHGIV
jgi:S-methylmethionine-dependent homocysteine/selenocysteine methylase